MEKPNEEVEGSIEHPSISTDILEMVKRDQEMRKTGEMDIEIDKENVEKLKTIITEIGWPTELLVGREAADQVWLIVQHADQDPEFQKQCLDLIRENTDGLNEEIGYLTDRVRTNLNQPQLYGTQFGDDKDGNWGPLPIKDIEHLESRRVEAGFEPNSYEEYKNHMMNLYQELKEKE